MGGDVVVTHPLVGEWLIEAGYIVTTSPKIETLATLPIDKRRGTCCEMQIITVDKENGDRVIGVGLFPQKEPTGIVIGIGATRIAALSDAQSTLQAALDSIDVAILKTSRM